MYRGRLSKLKVWQRILLRVVVVFLGIICSIVLLFVGALLFMPSLGGNVSEADRADYAKRATNVADGKFTLMTEFDLLTEFTDNFAGRTSGKGTEPEIKLPVVTPQFIENPVKNDFTLTWFGHSVLVMQISGMNIIIDPVFGDFASPVGFMGIKRYVEPPMSIEELPEIDICIISHDHYDHLDYASIKKIKEKTKRFIVPLGIENHLERWGVEAAQITNMAWWEEVKINGLTIACTPSGHYSGRKIIDQRDTLWASWVFMNENVKIYESGDTGYYGHFKEIYDKYGKMDFALFDCGQYNERWRAVHMFPEEAVQAAKDLDCNLIMPIHWGTFRLSNHSWDDPAERMVQSGEEHGIKVVTPLIGETMMWENIETYNERWWRNYK